MNAQTNNTQNTADEFRQAAKRLRDGAAYVAREVPWAALVKGTFKLAINVLRYSMGIAIYGLVIWPYRLLVAPTCAVAAGMAATQPEVDADWFCDQEEEQDFAGYYDPASNEMSAVRTPGFMTMDGRVVGVDGKLHHI
jgi:hypothetical protein